MEKNIVVGVYSDEIVSDNAQNLLNAFGELGVEAYSYKECKEKNISPAFLIGFDTEGLNDWQSLLNKGVTNFVWATDSVFFKNYNVIKQFAGYQNFILLNSTNADTVPVGKFLPKLTHGYLPVGVDASWLEDNKTEKDIDIAVVGSIIDVEEKLSHLKETMPELVFNLMTEVVDIALINPSLSMTEIFDIFQKQMGLEYTDEQIVLFMTELSDVITTKLYEKALASLKDYKLTFVGDADWEKYKKPEDNIVSPNNEDEMKEILNRSKMVLTIPSFSINCGISSVILKSVSAGCLVLTPITLLLKTEFVDSLGFFNPTNTEGLEQRVKYYLENAEERDAFVKIAQKIVSERHSWKNRAKSILDIIQVS